ncbi:MAG: hypothetical protein WCR72_18645, partial [Bacteroidota bacterium]
MHAKKNIHRLFLALLTLVPLLLHGQYYNLGQDPSALKWRQINTPGFRIIYPENFEQKAQKMIPMLNNIAKQGGKTLAFKPGKVPFILHNYNTEANAVTVWTPKRVELYTCPPQDNYAQDWLDQLVTHEYRHVVQLDRTNQGFTRVLSWLTGEQAAALVSGLFVPPWFMEGDAVCTETALSRSGRGRIPSFEMLLRAQVTQRGAYSYDKAALGSYKTFVPNQYVLGYSLVANVRRKYGYQAWVRALDEVAWKPYSITPFNHGLKQATGYGKEELYRMTMLDMDSMWKYQDAHTQKTAFVRLSGIKKNAYETYEYPVYLNDTLVISKFSSLDEITRFVLTGPKEFNQTIVSPGFLSSGTFSSVIMADSDQTVSQQAAIGKGNCFMLAWAETINDPRWENRKFSVIRTYDSRTGKTRSLTRESRYFAPAFAPGGSAMAVVSVDPVNRSSLLVLDAHTGEVKDTLLASDSDFYMTPSWSGDGKWIVYIKLDNQGKSINMCNSAGTGIKQILPPTFTEISNPVFAGGYVLYNGSYSGIQNIYAIDLNNNDIFQVTSAAFGAGNAHLSPGERKIVYSDYSASGYSLAETAFEPGTWKKLTGIRDYSPSLYKY